MIHVPWTVGANWWLPHSKKSPQSLAHPLTELTHHRTYGLALVEPWIERCAANIKVWGSHPSGSCPWKMFIGRVSHRPYVPDMIGAIVYPSR